MRLLIFALLGLLTHSLHAFELTIGRGHNEAIVDIELIKGGQYTLSASNDQNMILWDTVSGRPLRRFPHPGAVAEVRTHPDNETIAYTNFAVDKCKQNCFGLIVWNIETGEQLFKLENVNRYAFTRNGDEVELVTMAEKQLQFYEPISGQLLRKTSTPISLSFYGNRSFDVLTSETAIAREYQDLTVFSLLNGEVISKMPVRSDMYGFAINHDANVFAYVSKNGVEVRDSRTLEVVNLYSDMGFSIYDIRQLAFSDDGKRLYLAGADELQTIHYIDREDGSVHRSRERFRQTIANLAVSKTFLITDARSTRTPTKIWSAETLDALAEFPQFSLVTRTMSISDTGDTLLAGYVGRSYSERTGEWLTVEHVDIFDLTRAVSDAIDTEMSGWNSAFSASGTLAVVGDIRDTEARLIDLPQGLETHRLGDHFVGVSSAAFTSDSNTLFTLSRLNPKSGPDKLIINEWDASSGSKIRSITPRTPAPSSPVQSIQVAPDGRHLLLDYFSYDKSHGPLKIFDAVSGELVSNFGGFSWGGRDVRGNTYTAKPSRSRGAGFLMEGNFVVAAFSEEMKGPDLKHRPLRLFRRVPGTWDYDQIEEHDVNAKRLEFATDGKHFAVIGDNNRVEFWKLGENQRLSRVLQVEEDAEVYRVAMADDLKIVAVATEDGRITVRNRKGEEVVTIWPLPEKSHVITTPDGYYTASGPAARYAYMVDGLNHYTFDATDLAFNRPDIIAERLGMAEPTTLLAYRKAWEKRLTRQGISQQDVEDLRTRRLPKVEILSDINGKVLTTPELDIAVRVTPTSRRANRAHVSINGVPMYGQSGIALDKPAASKPGTQTVPVTLSPGRNLIKVTSSDKNGIHSLAARANVFYTPSMPVKEPVLNLITIGVSDFKESQFNLNYAAKDASDIAAALGQEGQAFSEIKTTLLKNEEVTLERIQALRSQLAATHVDDHVVIFVASHGMFDDDYNFYLATHDMDFAKPARRGLAFDQLSNLLDGIPARNKLLMIDACHSGEIDIEQKQSFAMAANDGALAARGLTIPSTRAEEASPALALEDSFELMNTLFADLRNNNGSIVVSAAAGKEYALEGDRWQNGAFTFAVLEGLENGAADKNDNGRITTEELRDHVFDRVRELTHGMQNPTSRSINHENEFFIWSNSEITTQSNGTE